MDLGNFEVWVPILAALVAGATGLIIAVVQARRSRQLEIEKNSLAVVLERERADLARAQSEVELGHERLRHAEERDVSFRRAQVLPFLEALAQLVDVSYAIAYTAPRMPELAGQIPHLRAHADSEIHRVYEQFGAMARNRAQLFLAVDERVLEDLSSELIAMSDALTKAAETRERMWAKQAATTDVWEAHRVFVRHAYAAMLLVRNSLHHERLPQAAGPSSDDLAERLLLAFERLSHTATPYGRRMSFTWSAIWELDPRPEVQEYLTRVTGSSDEEIIESAPDLLRTLRAADGVVDADLGLLGRSEEDGTTSAGRRVYTAMWTCLKFASDGHLREFERETLPAARLAHCDFWSIHRSPAEFTIPAAVDRDAGQVEAEVEVGSSPGT